MPQDSQATFALQIDRQNCGESLLQAETRGSLTHRAFRDRPSDDYADLGLAAVHPMTSLRLSAFGGDPVKNIDDLRRFEPEIDLQSDALATKDIDYG